MSLITAFEITTLAGVSLSFLAVIMSEMGDALVDRRRRLPLGRKPLIRQAHRVATSATGITAVAANNPLADLPKVA